MVSPQPLATRCSLAGRSWATWTTSGRSSRPGRAPRSRSGPDVEPAIHYCPRRARPERQRRRLVVRRAEGRRRRQRGEVDGPARIAPARHADGAQAPDIELTPMLMDLLGISTPGFSCLVTLVAPRSRGTVRLASADPAAAPLVDPRYYAAAAEREVVVEGLRRTLEMCASPIMRALIGPASFPTRTDDASLLRSAQESTVSINHPASTCRAGDGEQSVVGPDLRVHGTTGLRVADASVMPAITHANTYAPSVMIGERAAELIARERDA
ncbi:GMC oxidoreductase [Streptomyces sp. NPDC088732]|uniref:GMC oxidoreductase n=1 Tax=Streptomyces sp. NPDC088732 TaxID=3365879 RepID=UPI00382FA866